MNSGGRQEKILNNEKKKIDKIFHRKLEEKFPD